MAGERGFLCSDRYGAVPRNGRRVAPWSDTGAPRGPQGEEPQFGPGLLRREGFRQGKQPQKAYSVLLFSAVAPEPDELYVPLDSTRVCGALAIDPARDIYDQVCTCPLGAHSPLGPGEVGGQMWTQSLLSK